MKIAFIGNVGNCTYWYVKHLREIGIDADLYIEFKKYDSDGKPILLLKTDPREEDLSLGENLPDWIKFYHIYSLKSFFTINKAFGSYALNIVFARLPIIFQFCKVPMISFATGNDMRGWIFRKSLMPFLLQRALKKSKMILYDNIDMDTLNAIDKLGVKNHAWIPDYVDKDYLRQLAEQSATTMLDAFKEKFVCFFPSRPIFKIKGNDILLRGLALFLQKNKNLIRLLIVDRDGDAAESIKLINELGIQEHVTIIPRLPQMDVIKIMKNCALVFGYFKDDESGIHHFPVLTEDALAMGNIIISSYDEQAFQKIIREEPPIIKATTDADVAKQLEFVLNNYDNVKQAAGINGPLWIEKYHSKKFITQKLVEIIEKYA